MFIDTVADVCKCTPFMAKWIVSGGSVILAIIIGVMLLVTVSKSRRGMASFWFLLWSIGVGVSTYHTIDSKKKWLAIAGGSAAAIGLVGLIVMASKYCHADEMSRKLDKLLGERFNPILSSRVSRGSRRSRDSSVRGG